MKFLANMLPRFLYNVCLVNISSKFSAIWFKSELTNWLWLTFDKRSILPQTKLANTDLGGLIENTQCGSFKIFLPLRFYVKSVLVICKPQKRAKNCHFDHLSSSEFEYILGILKRSKFSAYKIVKMTKMTVFHSLKSAKIDFTENQSCRKIAKFSNCWISTIKIPIPMRLPWSVQIGVYFLLICDYLPNSAKYLRSNT